MGYLKIIIDRYPDLFKVEFDSINEVKNLHFKDHRITTDVLHVDEVDSASILFRTVKNGIFSNIAMRLYFGIQDGYFNMHKNQYLSDDICLGLFKYNIRISSGSNDNGDFLVYNQQAITRRYTINKIISHV